MPDVESRTPPTQTADYFFCAPGRSVRQEPLHSHCHLCTLGAVTITVEPTSRVAPRRCLLEKEGGYFVSRIDDGLGGGFLVMKTAGAPPEITEAALRNERRRAENASRLKDQFVSLVAHDLRSPLGTVIGYLRLFTQGEEDPQRRALFDLVLESCDGMLAMIEELLDISRLQSGSIRVDKRHFLARGMVQLILNQFDYTAAAKQVTLLNHIPRHMRLYADIPLFREVIRNLVSNAVKFCRPGDAVCVVPTGGGGSGLEVRDTGVGVPKEMAEDLFRAEVKTTTQGTLGEKGTGLGLPYIHDIVAAHGGTIRHKSKRGVTRFVVRLPESKPTIVVVDDDEHMLRYLRVCLEEALDVEVHLARDGMEALSLLKENSADLVITDIRMPQMGGYELLAAMRRKKSLADIPVMVVTSSEGESRDRVFELGGDDFIAKPIDEAELITRARRYVCHLVME
jgi:signal transduction histidine kinase